MRLWNKIQQDFRLLLFSLVANGVQLVVIIGLLITIITIPTRFTFYIPPDLSNGVTLHANETPKSYVGQFAFYIWQSINNWPQDGTSDAYRNLQRYTAYLRPDFFHTLQTRYQQLQEQGQLQNRVRIIRPMHDQTPQVTRLSSGEWQVELVVRESEYVNGILVKDKVIDYPFLVEHYNGNAQRNPFGLVLAQFSHEPQVVKTIK